MLKELVAGVLLFATVTAASGPTSSSIQDTIFPEPLPNTLPNLVVPLPALDDIAISSVHLPRHINLTSEQREATFNYGRKAILEQCLAQKSLAWCDKPNTKPKQLGAYDIVLESLTARTKFMYKDDTTDSWRSHTGDILLDEYWFGDCDDLMSTTIDMLSRRGQPLDKMWIVLVAVKTKSTFDHVVGVVQDKDGKFWVVGDTDTRSSYPLKALTYRVVAVARSDDVMNWEDPRKLGIFYESTLQAL